MLNANNSLELEDKLFNVFFQVSSFSVVCDTTQIFLGSSSSKVPSFVIIALSLHHPFIPITSGCLSSPNITILYPKSEYLLTFLWILVTYGHVAFTTTRPFSYKVFTTFFVTP